MWSALRSPPAPLRPSPHPTLMPPPHITIISCTDNEHNAMTCRPSDTSTLMVAHREAMMRASTTACGKQGPHGHSVAAHAQGRTVERAEGHDEGQHDGLGA